MLDINGWNIDVYSLPKGNNRDKIPWIYDNLFEHEETNTACLIYLIAEVRMGWCIGFMAVYENKENPKLVFNTTSINFSGSKDAVSFNKSGEFIFAKACLYSARDNRLECPILVFNLKDGKFSFLSIVNGIHYSIEEIDSINFRLKDNYFDNRFKSRDGEIIKINEMKFYKLEDIDTLRDIYFEKGFFRKIFAKK